MTKHYVIELLETHYDSWNEPVTGTVRTHLITGLDAKPKFYILRKSPVPSDYYDQLRAKYGCAEV